jgi:RND family efflux transporter MFP subunit
MIKTEGNQLRSQNSVVGKIPVGILQIVAITALIVSAVLYARAPSDVEAAERISITTADNRRDSNRPLLTVARPQPGEHTVEVSATGTVVVRNSIDLVPEVTGRVVWASPSLQRGGNFRANETLLKVDPRDFELALDQAEAETHAAESTLELALATSEAAIANYALLNPGKKAPPLVAKLPQIEQAKATVEAAKAREEIARLDLSRTRFSLPFDGRVVDSHAEVGQLINNGQSFGEVFASDAIEALVPISPSQLKLIEPAVGRAASIRMDGATFTGSVARISPNLDERTRFAQLHLSIENSGQIYPGTFIDVEIAGPTLAGTILLPEAAEQANESVWTVRDAKLTRQQLTYINRNKAGIIVPEFEIGEGIVLGTVPGGIDGMMVAVESNQ